MPVYRKVNKDFFKEWTPSMAYILGFFAADGSITVNPRGSEYIDISICDRDLLYKIRKVMDSEHKIKILKRKNNWKTTYRLQIGSKEICNDLRRLGFRERKTHHLPFPNIPQKYTAPFVRGYFDGDGHVWIGLLHKERKRPMHGIISVFTSCSKNFLRDLKLTLSHFGLEGGSISSKTKKNAYRLLYSINDSILLYNLMYDNLQTDLFLERKKKVFEKFLDGDV